MDNPYGVSIILRFLIPGLYCLAAVGYVSYFVRASEKMQVWVRPLFLIGIVTHLLLFILLMSKRGTIPLATVFEGLFFCSLILSILYLVLEHVVNETCYGAFLLPVNVIISGMAAIFLNTGRPLPEVMSSIYFVSHASFLFTAYACFFLSFIIAVMYLLQHNEIKSRHLGFLFKNLPALENMDLSIARIDALGLGLLFLGTDVGFFWMVYASDVEYRMNIKIGFTILAGIVYLLEHLLRVAKGWKGQRASLISIAGFVLILITLFIGRHGY